MGKEKDSYPDRLDTDKLIRYFANLMISNYTVDDLLWDIAANCISKLGLEDCVIYLLNRDRNVLVQKAVYGPKDAGFRKILNQIEIPLGKGIVGNVAVNGRSELIRDTTLDSRYILDDKMRCSELAVPIKYQDEVLGVLDSEHSKKNFYTKTHEQIFEAIASMCAAKIRSIRNGEEISRKKAELYQLQSRLSQTRLAAFNAQMNPHFVFNALNSIHRFILAKDERSASKYLVRFSRLLRGVLEYTSGKSVSLDQEVELLRLYLELEANRFKNAFFYSVEYARSLYPADIFIPPMLIQPFVENAIWHGLLPKKGDCELKVRFKLLKGRLLECTVTDNGVGFAREPGRSAAVSGKRKPPRGIQLVKDRLELLNYLYHSNASVRIDPLPGAKGAQGGTIVRLAIPLLDDFA